VEAIRAARERGECATLGPEDAMPDESVNITEPRFHSLARAPLDSRPIIELAHRKQPCGFMIEFAVGPNEPGPVMMRAHEVGVRDFPEVVPK